MSHTHYSPEELEILDFIENENPKSIPDLANEIAQLRASVKAKMSKKKAINLRLLEYDLQSIKTEAISAGIPYQTLISSILHQYVQGNLVAK
jgi:predicted DNA binding CopG/RHH family protein